MSNWTPGPWKVAEFHGYTVIGEGVEVASTHLTDVDDGEALANAQLIAAAPELLSVLSGLLAVACSAISAGDWKVDGACDPDGELARAAKAIAKAEGE